MLTKEIKLQELYEIDDSLWLEETIKLLKERKLNEIDLDNLIEELESLAKRDKLAMASLLEQLIRHLLLLEYWDEEYEKNYRHWRSEIRNFRGQLNKGMTSNFYNYLRENFNEIYQDAREYVIDKSGIENFPRECQYTLEQLLDKNWLPNES